MCRESRSDGVKACVCVHLRFVSYFFVDEWSCGLYPNMSFLQSTIEPAAETICAVALARAAPVTPQKTIKGMANTMFNAAAPAPRHSCACLNLLLARCVRLTVETLPKAAEMSRIRSGATAGRYTLPKQKEISPGQNTITPRQRGTAKQAIYRDVLTKASPALV